MECILKKSKMAVGVKNTVEFKVGILNRIN